MEKPPLSHSFIKWLERLDKKAYATLRRVFTQDDHLENYMPAYPYVEPFLQKETEESNRNHATRRALFLIAGLYCMHNQPASKQVEEDADEAQDTSEQPNQTKVEDSPRIPNSLGYSLALFHRDKYPEPSPNPSSLELRFIQLLDSDEQQFAYYLRQCIQLLKDVVIDWPQLAKDILLWHGSQQNAQKVRRRWAADFYRYYQKHSEN